MNSCPECKSNNVIQSGSRLTRILTAFYIFMSFYFFTGAVMVLSVVAIIPLIIPFKNDCSNCNATFYRVMNVKRVRDYRKNNIIDKFILETFPYFFVIVILIGLYPYTGLARIIYLPFVCLINTVIITMSLGLQYTLKSKLRFYIREIVTILLTIICAIYFYPQDSGERIWELL